MVYLFQRKRLKPEIRRDDIGAFLDELLSHNDVSIHAVYTDAPDPDEDDRRRDHLDIRRYKDTDKLRFTVMPSIPTEFSHFTESLIDEFESVHIEPPEATPRILESFSPRRIVIDDSSVRSVDRYIEPPYRFLGFEVRFPLYSMDVFASSYQNCAGLKRYRKIAKPHRPAVRRIVQSLNSIVTPEIPIKRVVG